MANCSKPACGRRGEWILAYDYAEGICVLQETTPGELSPHHYLLCARCADRLKPPRGWTLLDHRPPEEPVVLPDPAEDDAPVELDQPLLFGESA